MAQCAQFGNAQECARRYARVNTESMTAELLPVSQYLQFKVGSRTGRQRQP